MMRVHECYAHYLENRYFANDAAKAMVLAHQWAVDIERVLRGMRPQYS